jgi:hypothetical protein
MLRAKPAFSLSGLARASAAVGVATVVASGLLAYEAVSRPPAVSVAGEAKMQMLRDEHQLIADYVAGDIEARKLAGAAADRDIARMRVAAQEGMQRQTRIAAADEAKIAAKPERKTVAATMPMRVAGSAPLQVTAMTFPMPNATVPPATGAMAVRYNDGPVRSRLRQLASDVRSLPSWLHNAADWMAEAVPAPKVRSLPLWRQFRAET